MSEKENRSYHAESLELNLRLEYVSLVEIYSICQRLVRKKYLLILFPTIATRIVNRAISLWKFALILIIISILYNAGNSVNSVHSVQLVHSVNSVQPVFSITDSNSFRRRRTLWRRLYLKHQGTQYLFWWHWRYVQSIINWGRGSKKLLGCTKLWNRVSSVLEIVTTAYMTIFPRKNFHCSRGVANQRATLNRCWINA